MLSSVVAQKMSEGSPSIFLISFTRFASLWRESVLAQEANTLNFDIDFKILITAEILLIIDVEFNVGICSPTGSSEPGTRTFPPEPVRSFVQRSNCLFFDQSRYAGEPPIPYFHSMNISFNIIIFISFQFELF